jgi:aminoglycoside/choline kinase family phosphotransferase
MHEPLLQMFERRFGTPPVSVADLGADGSNRTYFRLVGPAMERAIGAYGPDREENRTFFSYSRTLREAGFNVPELYETDEGQGLWLEEDLGDTTLFDALVQARNREEGPFPESMVGVYERVLDELPRLQLEGARRIDFEVAYPRPAFDKQSIRWDLNYFKYHFLKLAHIPFSEQRLEQDFGTLCWHLLQVERDYFLYRDFQSRNIMLCEGEPWFIDYQGGRKGALHYDVASLLYDAKATIPGPLRDSLLEHYLDALEEHKPVDRDHFREYYSGYVIVRILQALGAYGYRGFYERKPRFLQSVPYAARNLNELLTRGLPLELPELQTVFERIVDRWTSPEETTEEAGLTLRIMSFSYRGGYPQDEAGHGGGYVFDCRALPNPGREERYRTYSGLDEPVIRFFDSREEPEAYWRGVRHLVDAQIEEYLRRDFGSLTISFGCTGGQHRSVYMAERLAGHVRETFPQVAVKLLHRERKSWPPRPDPDEAEKAEALESESIGP